MYKKIAFFLMCFYCLPGHTKPEVKFENLTILVNSFDKYSDLWDPFHHFLFEKWPSLKTYNRDVPILLISNSKTYDDPRVTPVQIENETSWSDTFLTALEQVDTDYVLILLEDYILDQPVNEKRLQEIFLGMQKANAAYLQINVVNDAHVTGEPHPTIPGVRSSGKHDLWRTSLQACIWHKEDLKWILKKGENIWAFEIAGSLRSEGMPKPFFKTLKDAPISYLNASQEGYLNADVIRWIRQNGGTINTTTLPVNEDHKTKLWMKSWEKYLYWHIYQPLKSGIKSLLN